MSSFERLLTAPRRGFQQMLRAALGTVTLKCSWPLLAALLFVSAPTFGQTIGKRDFIDGSISLPSELLNEVGALLPERSNANAAFTASVFSPNLFLTEEATVTVTFVHEGAGYHNSLGYFTYTEAPLTIVDAQLIFPDASFGDIASGEYSTLRDANGIPRLFPAGTKIGFFLVADGWNKEAEILAWDPATATLPSLDPAENRVRAPGRGTYTTIDEINPEMDIGRSDIARHTALLKMEGIPNFLGGADFLLMAFEDLFRTGGDNDFNDAVFLVQSTPPTAINQVGIFIAQADDPDGDGAIGSDDAFPNDPERASISSYPPFGWNGLGLEDLYPAIGDGDYNDTVIIYRFDLVLNTLGAVKDVRGTFHMLARGGSYEHRLGLHIPTLPEGATGEVLVERFLSDDEETHELEPSLSIQDLITLQERRIETIFPSSNEAMPNPLFEVVVNTNGPEIDRLGASSRLLMSFDVAQDMLPVEPSSKIMSPPWDLYWLISNNSPFVDVHFKGVDAFLDRPEGYPEETGPNAFADVDGLPWLIEVPFNWRFPQEAVPIGTAYPDFTTWASSSGASETDWYERPEELEVSREADEFLVNRSWTIDIPSPTSNLP